jgi:RNA 3'-terminal phosphate cyclase (ATP)
MAAAVSFTRAPSGALTIDGSSGEGGGQILRTALTLSAITGTPLVLTRIRGGRAKPGLQRQHCVCVQAAAALCGGAAVTGGGEGSTALTFTPPARAAAPPLQPAYQFDIGTAGATTLVLATALPIVWARLRAGAPPVVLTITGGTHNPHAPSSDYLRATLLPLLRAAGLACELDCPRQGFYPAGGGRLVATVRALPGALPPASAGPALVRTAGGPLARVSAALLRTAAFPAQAAQAHCRALGAALGAPAPAPVALQLAEGAAGAAAAALATATRACGAEQLAEVCAVYSERRGQSSEDLARALAAEVEALRATSAPIGHRTADQLLLPLALFTRGALLRCQASDDLHFATNAGVIEAFLGSGLVTTASADAAAPGGAEAGGGEGGGGGGGGGSSLHPGVLVTVRPRVYYGACAAEVAAGGGAEAAAEAGGGGGSGSTEPAAPAPAAAPEALAAAPAVAAPEAAAAAAAALTVAEEGGSEFSASKRARTGEEA